MKIQVRVIAQRAFAPRYSTSIHCLKLLSTNETLPTARFGIGSVGHKMWAHITYTKRHCDAKHTDSSLLGIGRIRPSKSAK